MTDKELIDGFLAGELDEAGMAQLESELAACPELLHELAEQQKYDMALRVLLEDETADQQVTVSVLGVLRGKPLDQFKTDLLRKVKAEDARKRREEEAVKIATDPVPVVPDPRPAPRPRASASRSRWGWGVAAGVAAGLVAALVWTLLGTGEAAPESRTAFLLLTSPGAKVHRGAEVLPALQYMILHPGDRLVTGEGDRVQMGFPADTTRLELVGAGSLTFVRGGQGKVLELAKGEVEGTIAAQGEPLEIVSPRGKVRAEDAQVRLLGGAEFVRAEVRSGSVTLTRASDGRSVRIGADQYAVAGRDVDLVAKALEKPAPGSSPVVVVVARAVQGDVFVFRQSPADRTPLKAGQGVEKGQGVVTEGARGRVLLEYPDQTRLEVGGDTVVRHWVTEDGAAKHVRLESGAVTADVVKQPAGRPMKLSTAHAEVGVVGTRFLLSSQKEVTQIHVEEGAVEFTRVEDRKSVVVRSGYAAVAAPGRPLEPALMPGGQRYLDVDLASGVAEGAGEWRVEGRTVRQEKSAAESPTSLLFKVDPREEGALLEAMVEVTRVGPEPAGNPDGWGFGLAAVFGDERVVLRSQQGGPAGSFFEFQDRRAQPFEHGQEGQYRLKLRIERKGSGAVLQGKIWQGEREPDGWMIEDEIELRGKLTQVGFQAARCACAFSSFRVKVLKEESR